MIYTLSMFNTGQVTLPKAWRSRFKTKKFVAREMRGGLFIKALDEVPEGLKDENVELYEEMEEGEKVSGIRFKKGIDPAMLLKYWPKIND